MASAKASLIIGEPVEFDSRIIPLPSLERVADYFQWRAEDAARNALSGYRYWTAVMWTTRANTLQQSCFKEMVLTGSTITCMDTTSSSETENREGFNPKTGKRVTARRRIF